MSLFAAIRIGSNTCMLYWTPFLMPEWDRLLNHLTNIERREGWLTDQSLCLTVYSTQSSTARSDELTRELYKQGIIVRAIPGTSLTRISTGFYHTEKEIDQMIEMVQAVQMSKQR